MVDSAKLTGLVIISSRRIELFNGLRKSLEQERIPFNDKLLENAINKMKNDCFLTQSEIRSNRLSVRNGIKKIIEEKPAMLQTVFDNYLKIVDNR